ncbi:hypothetical protein Tco_0434962 [Tanacetum coccineum]
MRSLPFPSSSRRSREAPRSELKPRTKRKKPLKLFSRRHGELLNGELLNGELLKGIGSELTGIPIWDIYTPPINHYTDAKNIWTCEDDSWKVSELTKDDRESQLYDDFGNASMQLNSKFVNNMLPEWSRFITEVKLNRGLKESNFDQLYAYLKQHECLMHQSEYQHISSESPQSSNQPSIVDNCQMDTGSTSTDNLIESLTNTLFLLNQSFKAHLPQTNNQLRTSSNARNNATVQDVVVQDARGRYNANNQGRPFQRNNARGNVVAGNAGAENSVNNFDDDVYDGVQYDAFDSVLMRLTHKQDHVMYVEDNEEHVVQSNVSSVRNDALMSILDEMHEQGVQNPQGIRNSPQNNLYCGLNGDPQAKKFALRELCPLTGFCGTDHPLVSGLRLFKTRFRGRNDSSVQSLGLLCQKTFKQISSNPVSQTVTKASACISIHAPRSFNSHEKGLERENLLLDLQKLQKNPIFHISVDIRQNTNFVRAFTTSANVPSIYIQLFWNTLTHDVKTGVYSFQVNEHWLTLSVDLLRKA